MLYLALALLGLALTLGCVLGAMNLRPVRIAPPWSLRLLHGAAGSGGLGVFLLATDTLARGDPAFRAGAGGLLAAALVLGFAALALWRLAPGAAEGGAEPGWTGTPPVPMWISGGTFG